MTIGVPTEPHTASIFESIADVRGDAPALIHGERVFTWRQFDDRAARFAGALQAAGISPGAAIGICMRNCNEYVETYYGALKVRAVPVSINYRYVDDELTYLLNDALCEVVVVHASLAERMARVRNHVPTLRLLIVVDDEPGSAPSGAPEYEALLAESTPADRIRRERSDPLIFYTGGTTGMPKGMTTSVGARVIDRVNQYATMLGIEPPPTEEFSGVLAVEVAERGDTPAGIATPPLMHGTALNTCALPSLVFGGSVVTLPNRSFNASATWDAVSDCSGTLLTVVGEAMGKPLLLELDAAVSEGRVRDASQLRVIISSGMSWSEETKRATLAHLPHVTLIDIYASTEGYMGMSRQRVNTLPTDVPTFEPGAGVVILGEDGFPLESGTGEIGMIASPVPEWLHYRNDPVKTAETFRDINGRRYAVTGDWGSLASDGLLRPIGRGAKVINTGGEKVFSEEVENVIRDLPEVLDCLVVALPHPRLGQQVTAVVSFVPSESLSTDAVCLAVRNRLAAYKVPKLVVSVDDVPRHANSKPDYVAATRLAADGAHMDALAS